MQEKTRKRIFAEEEIRRSAEHGRRDVVVVVKKQARDYPALVTNKIDKGDNTLNPLADKRLGMKRQQLASKN